MSRAGALAGCGADPCEEFFWKNKEFLGVFQSDPEMTFEMEALWFLNSLM